MNKTTDNVSAAAFSHLWNEAKAMQAQRDAAVAALREAYELISNSDVKHFISTKLGEQARVHSAINKARAAIAAAEGEQLTNEQNKNSY